MILKAAFKKKRQTQLNAFPVVKSVLYKMSIRAEERQGMRGLPVHVSSRKIQVWGVLGGEEEQRFSVLSVTRTDGVVRTAETLQQVYQVC